MCRLYASLAAEPMRVECALVRAQNSLLAQSREDDSDQPNADGWGIACYRDHLPFVERRGAAAFQDLEFLVRAHAIRARIVVAHVRRASVGGSSTVNAHPFQAGRWVFAHNGHVPRFDALEPRLRDEVDPDLLPLRRGETDSELVFLWTLSRIREHAPGVPGEGAPLAEMVRGLRAAHEHLRGLCREADLPDLVLNVVMSDGTGLVASRFQRELYVIERDCAPRCVVCETCHCAECEEEPGRPPGTHGPRAVVIASEPLTDEPWRPVPESSILAVSAAAELEIHPAAAADVESA